MFRHVVLFRYQPTASADQRLAVSRGLDTLGVTVRDIGSLSHGSNVGTATANFDHAVVVDLTDEDSYATYAAHPVHRDLFEHSIRPILVDRCAVQYVLR